MCTLTVASDRADGPPTESLLILSKSGYNGLKESSIVQINYF